MSAPSTNPRPMEGVDGRALSQEKMLEGRVTATVGTKGWTLKADASKMRVMLRSELDNHRRRSVASQASAARKETGW